MSAALQIDQKPRRAHSRLRLGIPARILSLDGLQRATLVDLSQSGARLQLDSPAKVGGGMLAWLGFETFGDAVWQVGDQMALHFDEPIPAAWVLATRQWAPTEQRAERLRTRDAAREWVGGRAALGSER